ncbi:hypothetical protein BDA99DRAFT_566854 [Phascolomyces articulosus]|uniref:Uncharacterized protein n=1 Tax=Phascolomyces articulosus TaxID=60185 RepID=A0AAD5JL42_9FUNG|nr:hypothetical protein BDA99DRAFT_566854 [Phascolomyces articulosus]
MDQQPANNHQVLTKDTIQNALVHSAIPGVSALVPEQKFYVRADQKDDCLTLISELCSARWVQKNKRFGSSVIYNELLYCHRAGQYIPRREVRLAQKDSKKCGCQGALRIRIYNSVPDECEFEMLHNHTNHVCGSSEDVHT